jgi:hypothetical protein
MIVIVLYDYFEEKDFVSVILAAINYRLVSKSKIVFYGAHLEGYSRLYYYSRIILKVMAEDNKYPL